MPNSRRRAEKDLQAAGAAVLPVRHGKQRIWRGALSWLTPLVSHAAEILAGSQLPRILLSAGAIQGKVQRKHVDARFSEKTEGPPLNMPGDELTQAILRHVASLRNARHLKIGRSRRDVGIEPAARRRYQVDRNLGGGFSCLSFATSAATRSIKTLLVGPRLEPIEFCAL